jgi:hypothetical protein
MLVLSALDPAISGNAAYAPELSLLVLLLLFIVLAGSLLMPVLAPAARLLWRLLVLAGGVMVRYAAEKVVDAIFWGAVALIGALLFWR